MPGLRCHRDFGKVTPVTARRARTCNLADRTVKGTQNAAFFTVAVSAARCFWPCVVLSERQF
jgi:hypothetical protein